MKHFRVSLVLCLVFVVVSSKRSKKAADITLNPAQWTRSAPPFRNMDKPVYQERIIDGIKANFDTFSFMASLWYKDKKHFCGGTILNDLTILTSANCIEGPKAMDIVPEDIFVRIGSANNQEDYLEYSVYDWHVATEFNIDKLGDGHDIGVLILNQRIDIDGLKPRVSKVCLPEGPNDPPNVDSCVVMGWGDVNAQTKESPEVLMQVEAPILSPETCSAHIDGVDMDQLLCAGFVEGGKDACDGDSGGPLMCRSSSDDTWLQYGIVSWGRGCAKTFGFYTKIIPNLEYIYKEAEGN